MSETKSLRSCANCACYIEATISPLAPPQGQCRRNPPMPAQVQIEKPRLLDNKVVMGKDGKPVTHKEVVNLFLYAPTAADKVCFDGWRPTGTPPGRPFHDRELADPRAPIVNDF